MSGNGESQHDGSGDDRLIDIQSRIAEQERMVEQLNEIIIQQANAIERLERHVAELSERMRAGTDDGTTHDQKPPHY